MMTHTLTVIGSVRPGIRGFEIHIDRDYRNGLKGLSQFSHAIVSWFADRTESSGRNAPLVLTAPYTSTEQDIGVFASRSPARPNPVGLSVIAIADVDELNGVLITPFIDAMPGTPLLDIKPYFPASDLARSATVPDHFSHWPACLEDSASFDWAAEFQ